MTLKQLCEQDTELERHAAKTSEGHYFAHRYFMSNIDRKTTFARIDYYVVRNGVVYSINIKTREEYNSRDTVLQTVIECEDMGIYTPETVLEEIMFDFPTVKGMRLLMKRYAKKKE